jgi:hypothetical protein
MTMGIKAKLHGRRYPWRRWFRMPEFVITRYTDFNGMAHSMGQQVRNAASRYGVRVGISVAPDGSTVRVKVKNPLPSPPPAPHPTTAAPEGGRRNMKRVKKRGRDRGGVMEDRLRGKGV